MSKVLNTRPAGQNKELSELLTQAGFEPIEIPLVDIIPLEDGLRKILRLQPSGYTGIFISSPNSIRQMHAALDEDFEAWVHKPFYLVGGKAKTLVESMGGTVAFFPQQASVAGFLEEYPAHASDNQTHGKMNFAQRWLHPCSILTRLDPSAFRKCGVEIDNVPVYRPDLHPEATARLLEETKDIMAALFCSGSAVDHFFKATPELGATLGTPQGILAISIGSSTSDALRKHRVENIKEAASADSQGLVDALKSAMGVTETKIMKKNSESKR
jgi:uroporphyrinogen-III synthase